jgi:hypothetical protein
MQEIMTAKVASSAAGKDLEQAVDELQKLLARSRNSRLRRARPDPTRAGHRVSRANDAEALALRAYGAWCARKAAGPTTARTSRSVTTRMAQAHARDVEGRRDAAARFHTRRSTSRAWSFRRDGAATERRITPTIRDRRPPGRGGRDEAAVPGPLRAPAFPDAVRAPASGAAAWHEREDRRPHAASRTVRSPRSRRAAS